MIDMSTGYPITKQPCTIHGVMPSYLQEVEKEAYMMMQKYGQKTCGGRSNIKRRRLH